MSKQTAVEWLQKQLNENGKLSAVDFYQAKQMEKQQIIEAVDVGFEEGSKFIEDIKLKNAEQYYNQTYKQQTP